ncbi:MAG: methionine ABC transporter ATP-binding protein [Eggerthellales bacterium]|nr:methionine ABC transporter ATP-binding protein [Eggerthellales bacterium]
MIEIQDVTKRFTTREGTFCALDEVNLTIGDGDIFGIIGESGAGKSTLVRCINLLERPTSGKILIDGMDVTTYQGKQLREYRSGVGMIFQNFGLFQQRTVLDNVMFPLSLKNTPKDEARRRAHELLELVGIADKETRYPSELSGGQQQRVAIARALVNNPKIMLCDEATSALDSRTTIQILDLLKSINQKLGVTMVLITHSLDVAKRACNKIAVIDRGRIAEVGPTQEVFGNPQSDVTKLLIAHYNGSIEDGEVL